MSWDGYITNLMANDFVLDAAIVGTDAGSESVWASHPGGKLAGVTAQEIKNMVASNRTGLFSAGASLAGTRCTVLRDTLLQDGVFTMDLRTKSSADDPDTYSICVGKSQKALVIVKAKKDVHGGKVNKVAFDMAEYLRKSNY